MEQKRGNGKSIKEKEKLLDKAADAVIASYYILYPKS